MAYKAGNGRARNRYCGGPVRLVRLYVSLAGPPLKQFPTQRPIMPTQQAPRRSPLWRIEIDGSVVGFVAAPDKCTRAEALLRYGCQDAVATAVRFPTGAAAAA